ncbi:type II toxin-antitoxin system RelE/ParE family toxin [Haliea atlantica]
MTFSFHPAAESEFLDSVGYYESEAPGLGRLFLDEFETLIELICEQPSAWRVEVEPDIRMVPLRRFPLSLIYRERAGAVLILAVAHQSRRPHYWRKRFEGEDQ